MRIISRIKKRSKKKNVLNEILRRLGNDFSKELEHFRHDIDCPSYSNYNSLLNTLVYIENNKDLTN